jgi:alkyl hydroperoxide reductase subunit F
MYDLIIIGGGPAGVAAGVYASRKRLNALLLTKEFGGQSVNSATIENFVGFENISGIEFAQTLERHLRAQDHIEIKVGVEVTSIKKIDGGFEVTDSRGTAYTSQTLLMALGSRYKRLGVVGEDTFEGKGVFYCSICDAPLMKNKDVIVVGGGNSALESIIDLLPFATNIYLLVRSNALKGDEAYQEKISSDPRVHILYTSQVKEFVGTTFLEKVVYTNTTTHTDAKFPISGAFVAIGQDPNTAMVKDLVELNERNQISVDRKTFQSSLEGIWAAGDSTDGPYHQINTAMGDAVNAVLNIHDYLKMKK